MNVNEWAEYCRAEQRGVKCRKFKNVRMTNCEKCNPFRCSEYLDGFGITCRNTPEELRAVGYYFGNPYGSEDSELGPKAYEEQIKIIQAFVNKHVPIQLTLF